MRLMQQLKNGVNKVFGAVKEAASKTTASLKESAQSYIGEVLIKSAFNKMKDSVLGMLKEETVTTSAPSLQSDAAQATPAPRAKQFTNPIQNSHGLMNSLLHTLVQPVTDAANSLSKEVEDTVSNVGKKIAQGLKDTMRSKVEGFSADDLMRTMKQVLDSSAQAFTSEAGASNNSGFNLQATLQIVGWVIVALGMMLAANGFNPEPAPAPTRVPQDDAPASPSFAM